MTVKQRAKDTPMKVAAHSMDEPVIVMERTLDAPRDLVWNALTDSKQVARWYGGHGFENPVCEMDVRPGGRWHHVMRTPDGVDRTLEFVFIEVAKPEKLAWRNADDSRHGGPYDNIVTVTLEAAGRQTKWKMVARFASFDDRDAALAIGFTTVLAEGVEKFTDLINVESKVRIMNS
jgi:uncharacterized protein YndB with AHSA1/START domain